MFNVRFDLGDVTRRFKKLREKTSRGNIVRSASRALVGHLADYIRARSESRHTTANRLGATPTNILKFVRSGAFAYSDGGGKIYTHASGREGSVFIGGVPFIQRAFHSLHVVPKNASALTIPIHREAYAKRVKDLEGSGWSIFRPRGKRVLMGKKGSGRAIPLYALVKSATIPKDTRLLPSSYLMNEWTEKAVREELEK